MIMDELTEYTIDDVKEWAQYLRLQQLREVHPGYAQLSPTAKVRVMVERQRRQDVPPPPDTLGDVVRIQRARGQR